MKLSNQSLKEIKRIIEQKLNCKITKVEQIVNLFYKADVTNITTNKETFYTFSIYCDKGIENDVLMVSNAFGNGIFKQPLYCNVLVVSDYTLNLELKKSFGSIASYCNDLKGVEELTKLFDANKHRIREINRNNLGHELMIEYVVKTEKDFRFFNQFFNNYRYI